MKDNKSRGTVDAVEELLRLIRELSQIRQNEIAKSMGVSKQVLSRGLRPYNDVYTLEFLSRLRVAITQLLIDAKQRDASNVAYVENITFLLDKTRAVLNSESPEIVVRSLRGVKPNAPIWNDAMSLYRSLFPNDRDRDSEASIARWLNPPSNAESRNPDIHDLMFVVTLLWKVTGLAKVTVNRTFPFVYVDYVGLRNIDYQNSKAKLREALTIELQEIHPEWQSIKAYVFEAEIVDLRLLARFANGDVSYCDEVRKQLSRLKRIQFFQTEGALLAYEDSGSPFRLCQPSLNSQSQEWNDHSESTHWLMLRSTRGRRMDPEVPVGEVVSYIFDGIFKYGYDDVLPNGMAHKWHEYVDAIRDRMLSESSKCYFAIIGDVLCKLIESLENGPHQVEWDAAPIGG